MKKLHRQKLRNLTTVKQGCGTRGTLVSAVGGAI